MQYKHRNSGTCSVAVAFDLTDGIVSDVHFAGGCDGNLKAIGKLVEGSRAEDVIRLLKGNTCGYKRTSCADQLAQALEAALAEQKKKAGQA